MAFVSAAGGKAVVSRLIKLGSFQSIQLLSNKQFRINIFRVCGPAGYTCDMKAHLDDMKTQC
jgi:hypothetical protein